MAMAAISEMPTRGLVRFQDVVAAMDHNSKAQNPYAGFQGFSGLRGLGVADPDFDDYIVSNGIVVYTDLDTGGTYTLDDNGNPTYLQRVDGSPSPGGSSTLSNMWDQIFRPAVETGIKYALPSGQVVTTSTRPPVKSDPMGKYLLLGGLAFATVLLLLRRG